MVRLAEVCWTATSSKYTCCQREGGECSCIWSGDGLQAVPQDTPTVPHSTGWLAMPWQLMKWVGPVAAVDRLTEEVAEPNLELPQVLCDL